MYSPKENKKTKILLGFLLTLALAIGSCTQGKDGEQAGEGVDFTTEAPSVNNCEKPENLNNILCHWVATKMTTKAINFELQYDEQGRIEHMAGKDPNGHTIMKGDLTYNQYGLWQFVSYSNPNPPDSENYTQVETRTTYYNPQGKVEDVISETKVNGSYDSGYVMEFSNNGLEVETTHLDNNQNNTNKETRITTLDPQTGKIKTVEEKEVDTQSGDDLKWTFREFEYVPDTGRLWKMTAKHQNCRVKACGGMADPAQMDPTNIEVVELKYDEEGRLKDWIQTSEGELNYSVNPPTILSDVGDPPVPDKTASCVLSYDIETKAPIAKEHPIQFLMSSLGQSGFDLLFNEKDIFSKYTCPTSLSNQPGLDMEIHWVRLWEALPEGKEPGSAE